MSEEGFEEPHPVRSPNLKTLGRIWFTPMKWPYLAILIPILLAAFFYFYPQIENLFIFFPQRAFDSAPESLRLAYEDCYFTTEDGKKLHSWFFPGEKGQPVILHFHGNAGNISHRLDLVQPFVRKGLSVFLFDYRGFGRSEGRPSEQGLYRDGMAAFDSLVQKRGIPPDNIVLHGHSIGAAVAVEVALEKKVRALVLESAFTSTRDMAKTMPLFLLLYPFLPANYNNLEKVSHLLVPKLIIHGEEDEVVPFSMGQKLFEAAADPKFFYPVEKAGHNDVFLIGGERYFDVFAEFARDATLARRPSQQTRSGSRPPFDTPVASGAAAGG
jgi:fermentation-respiration switch protein FrsA (DUF1100 family)